MPGCPASHITPEIRGWISQYRWLKLGKTPMEMGLLSIDELDPRYFEAMEFIDSETARLEKEYIKRKRGA